jgi:hypothetical protein
MYDGIMPEAYKDYIESELDRNFKDQINEIHDFYIKHTFYPRDSTNVKVDEKRMARLCVKIRT